MRKQHLSQVKLLPYFFLGCYTGKSLSRGDLGGDGGSSLRLGCAKQPAMGHPCQSRRVFLIEPSCHHHPAVSGAEASLVTFAGGDHGSQEHQGQRVECAQDTETEPCPPQASAGVKHLCPTSLPTRFAAKPPSCTELPNHLLALSCPSPSSEHPSPSTQHPGSWWHLPSRGCPIQRHGWLCGAGFPQAWVPPSWAVALSQDGWGVPRVCSAHCPPGGTGFSRSLNPGTSTGNLCSSKHP